MKKYRFLLFSLIMVFPFSALQGQTIDLIWQGEGYAPPFYQGRTLWSKQGVVNLLAIPHGLGNPTSLNYKWTRNGTVLGNLNGIGVNSLSIEDTILSKPQTIKVEIISDEQEEMANASVTIMPTVPLLAVYENNPLYGFLFHKEANGAYPIKEKEVTFAAFPLFFSALNRSDNALTYSWRANGSAPESGSMVTYRIPDDTSGSSAVAASISHAAKIIQEARKNFLVQFGEQ